MCLAPFAQAGMFDWFDEMTYNGWVCTTSDNIRFRAGRYQERSCQQYYPQCVKQASNVPRNCDNVQLSQISWPSNQNTSTPTFTQTATGTMGSTSTGTTASTTTSTNTNTRPSSQTSTNVDTQPQMATETITQTETKTTVETATQTETTLPEPGKYPSDIMAAQQEAADSISLAIKGMTNSDPEFNAPTNGPSTFSSSGGQDTGIHSDGENPEISASQQAANRSEQSLLSAAGRANASSEKKSEISKRLEKEKNEALADKDKKGDKSASKDASKTGKEETDPSSVTYQPGKKRGLAGGASASRESVQAVQDPWLAYVAKNKREEFVVALSRDESLREKLRKRIEGMRKQRGHTAGQEGDEETLEFYAQTLAEAEKSAAEGKALEDLAPLNSQEAFSMDYAETKEKIREFLSELDEEASPQFLSEDPLFSRISVAHRRSLQRGDVKAH